jgi:beta-glucuronidase
MLGWDAVWKACLLVACALPFALGQALPGAREVVTLSRGWRFQIDISDLGEKEGWYKSDFNRSGWGSVDVPRAWDLFERAMWGYEGLGWYAIGLEGSAARPGRVQRLKFGRVQYQSRVWLNGELLGENTNGWLPFEFDVSGRLKAGQVNQVVMRVDNRTRPEWLPGARRIEWVQYGGILRPVELETSAPVYISDLAIQAGSPQVQCRVEITAAEERELTVRVRAAGATASQTLRVAPGRPAVSTLTLSLTGVERWSPESPRLYELTATLEAGGRTIDRASERFGIRQIEVSGRRIVLNGKPLRLQGVNRYDEYAPYGPNPPRNLMIEDVERMKRAGVNAIRVHYPQSPELISLYDQMGLLMIEEVPINWWDRKNEGIPELAVGALERMIRRDKNHPAIIIWSMANESPTDTEIGIQAMRRLMRRAKELDATRLVTFVVSPGDVSRHTAFADADVVATNMYAGQFTGTIARHIGELETLVRKASAEYLRRSARAYPDKPLIVTEYGTRGIRGIHGDIEYSEEFQAAFIRAAWKGIQDCEEVSGGVLWSWADYYHRRDFILYAPFGPYGVVTVDRQPKAALAALAEAYGGTAAPAAPASKAGRK